MSISYEEALATLEAMFSAPWTRETLDLVLRHEKGHMENTCDRILSYGSDNDPRVLIQQLQSGQGISSTEAAQSLHSINVDEEIARQLAGQSQGGRAGGRGGSSSGRRGGGAHGAAEAPRRRGTPTVLPKEFLRIPGYPHRSVLAEAANAGRRSGSVSNNNGLMVGGDPNNFDDEALARMLQDEFFSQELARNPEFAHLAGGAGVGGSGNFRGHRTGRSGAVLPPGQRRSSSAQQQQQQQPQGPNLMDKISLMGDSARKRLAILATQFESQLNQTKTNLQKANRSSSGGDAMGGGPAGMSRAERRGLLDDNEEDEDMIEFEMRKNK